MRKYQYLRKQFSKWYVEMFIPKDVQHHFIHGEDSLPHLRGKQKTKLSKCLHTYNKDLADIRKLDILQEWKLEIRAARQKERGAIEDVTATTELMREIYRSKGQGEDAAKAVVAALFAGNADETDDTRIKIYETATGKVSKTADFVDEWLGFQKYSPYVAAEAGKFVRDTFAKKFPTFEEIDRKALRLWVADMEMGRNGYNANKRRTVGKKISYVSSYWKYCEDRYTDCPNICTHEKVLGDVSRTKASQTDIKNTSYLPFEVEECWRLYRAAVEDGYPHLADIIKLGMYTGCRIGELCNMRVEDATTEYLCVRDSKTYSGIREIPIHKDIQQLVERLSQTSTDGFLLSNLSTDNQYKDRARAMSQKFGRLKSKLGFKTKRHSFHSFRATLANRFENASVDVNFAARIIGHAVTNMTYGLYSGKIDWKNAVEAMGKIEYGKD
jgi:integrase